MSAPAVLCFSHLRWNFVFQRPNHLMTRCARDHQVFFIEEPIHEAQGAELHVTTIGENLTRVVPDLPDGLTASQQTEEIARMLVELCAARNVRHAIHWYYTPMMLPLGERLPCDLVVYDCMDELSNFLHAPKELTQRESELMRRADVMFTGGMALYDAKRHQHPNVHGIPSSVDAAFFAKARAPQDEPGDQASIARPRLGYCGVIDERMDLGLLEALARARPAYQLVMLGPIVKIDPDSLPKLPNVHYLGGKKYEQLPAYLAGWDVALMPFALNDATRFISPTKTPEYLAAGRRVVSTAIRDVVEPYERHGLVRIGRTTDEFIAQVDAALADGGEHDHARDAFLAKSSWDDTWSRMQRLMREAAEQRRSPAVAHATSHGTIPERGVHV